MAHTLTKTKKKLVLKKNSQLPILCLYSYLGQHRAEIWKAVLQLLAVTPGRGAVVCIQAMILSWILKLSTSRSHTPSLTPNRPPGLMYSTDHLCYYLLKMVLSTKSLTKALIITVLKLLFFLLILIKQCTNASLLSLVCTSV